MDFDIETFFEGEWHHAAALHIKDPGVGYLGEATVAYEPDYFVDHAANDYSRDARTDDFRALSLNYPVDLQSRRTPHWPPFLLDMMPQGHARRKLAAALGLAEQARSSDLALLLRSAGNTIGNLRISQAARSEKERLDGVIRVGVSEEEILAKTDTFNEVVDRFAMLASGSSGLQGEWPKVAMTRANDGLYYPDPLVQDGDAERHVIVKLLRSNKEADLAILAGEAIYSQIAKQIGLNVAETSTYENGVLIIPRFDRAFAEDGGLIRNGQESFVSAIGVAEFGHIGTHEVYIDMLKRFSSKPYEDIAEYVKRDVTNLALGNSDNHGRNSAIAKHADGSVRLTPLFDFAPMKLAPENIMRSTNWECMRASHRQSNPDWKIVCATVFPKSEDAARLWDELVEFSERLRLAPRIAENLGAAPEVFRAIRACEAICDGLVQAPAKTYGMM